MSAVPRVTLNDGRQMPGLGLGTWQAKPGEGIDEIKVAIDVGYRHIDCALIYQNEKAIGQAIRDKIGEGVVKREDLFITSKLWNTYHRPDLVLKGCKKTLKNLGLEYIDLFLMHWPMGFKPTDRAEAESQEHSEVTSIKSDPEFFPVDESGQLQFSDDDYVETWKEMEKCLELGLTKSLGVSNFNIKQLERLLQNSKIKPVTNQVEYHPYLNQKKLREFCKAHNIVVTAYSPLGAQSATRKPEIVGMLEHPVVKKLAEEKGKTTAQIILKYLVQLGLVPIPKSSNPQRLKENISVFDFLLTPEEVTAMEGMNIDQRICVMPGCEGHKDFPFGSD